MKKALLTLCALLAVVVMITSCDSPMLNHLLAEKDVSSAWNHCWFEGSREFQFIENNGEKFIRYLPDSRDTTIYLKVVSDSDGTVAAKVLYSKDGIRETGIPVRFNYTLSQDHVTLTSDSQNDEKYKTVFTAADMISYQGVPAVKFNVPAVQTVYFSALAGEYELSDAEGIKEFNVASKVNVVKSSTEYWFASVVDLKEADGIYDFLLVHQSNTDPGVTGDSSKEPFINSQDTVWNYMKISPADDGKSKVEWSSKWSSSPYEALKENLDQSGIFNKEVKIQEYVYNFYFDCSQDQHKENKDAFMANLGDPLKSYTIRSAKSPDITWAQLKSDAGISSLINTKLSEEAYKDKRVKNMWYNTGAIGMNAYNVISDSNPVYSVGCNVYIELEEKPQSGTKFPETLFGTYIRKVENSPIIVIDGSSFKYNSDEYTCSRVEIWQTQSSYNEYAVELTNGDSTYISVIVHYYKAATPYLNVRPPLKLEGDFPEARNYTNLSTPVKNFYKQ